jgi:hypothetical protein
VSNATGEQPVAVGETPSFKNKSTSFYQGVVTRIWLSSIFSLLGHHKDPEIISVADFSTYFEAINCSG